MENLQEKNKIVLNVKDSFFNDSFFSDWWKDFDAIEKDNASQGMAICIW